MVQPPPEPAVTSNLLSTQSALIATLTSFLTVSIHHILFLRRIYPPSSFLSTRAYDYPVRQNRHPAVCRWVQNAVEAVQDQLERGSVEKVALCIFDCDNNAVLERWTFDLRALPIIDREEMDTMFERASEDDGGAEGRPDDGLRRTLNVVDLEAQFKAMLSRFDSAAGKTRALLEDREYSFTLTMEVKEHADRPVGRQGKDERKWVAAESDDWMDDQADHDITTDATRGRGRDRAGKTVPVRRLEAGELRMEVWVEESKAKLDMINERATVGSVQAKWQTLDQRQGVNFTSLS